jgi:hypothetical protein
LRDDEVDKSVHPRRQQVELRNGQRGFAIFYSNLGSLETCRRVLGGEANAVIARSLVEERL